MRYLWIEDFDGGKSGRTEIKRELERYFQIADKNINLCTLEKTLEFLDIPSNWNRFDAVLIDIRFKVCEKEQDEVNIYSKYYSSFLTKEKYDYYTYKINGDANTASSGVLLYLALIHRYNYNQKRIAFVSANVDETSDKLSDINNMREYVSKAKYGHLTESDKDDFSMLNENIFELYMNEMNITEEEAEDIFPIPEKECIDWKNIDQLTSQINEVEEQLKTILKTHDKRKEIELKYNSVKEEFENVGLKVPRAFPKPGGSYQVEISWEFQKWVNEVLNVDYYKLRSVILPICMNIKKFICNPNNKSELSYRSLFGIHNDKTEDMLHMLSEIVELFPENVWTDNNCSLYTRIVRECVSLSDGFKPRKGVVNDRVAAESVLKIVRNWMSHQGIKNIEAYDVAFVFYALVVSYFTVNNTDNTNIDEAEKLILEFDDKNGELLSDDISKQIIKAECVARKRHKEAYERFVKRVEPKQVEKSKNVYTYNEHASIYDTISAIGNQNSDIRDDVCMEYIYLLYLGIADISRNSNIVNSCAQRMMESGKFDI